MPNNYTTQHSQHIEEDEIDLRELFKTIGRYKKSIIFITLLITIITAIIAYRMPKYYKTTTTIEVKPKAGESQGFSLGGAGALLGLSGMGGGSSSIDKDAVLLGMYRVNDKVLDSKKYSVQYYNYDRFRYTELSDANCSISISDIHIPDYRKFGMEIKFEPISSDKFRLSSISRFFDTILGVYSYDTAIQTESFKLTVHKNDQGEIPEKLILNANKRYIFSSIISKNLSASIDKSNPFIKISYLDTLPRRSEAYVRELIDNYTQISIGFEIEDADISLDSLQKQINEVEKKVMSNSKILESYKSKNMILSPGAQAGILLKEQANIDSKLMQNNYKQEILSKLRSFAKKNQNIDAIAPSLIELGDRPTIALISKLQTLQLEATSLAQEYKAAYPKLKSVKAKIKILKKKIKSNLSNLARTLDDQHKVLVKLGKKYTEKLKKAPAMETELTSITQDYTLNQKIYLYLLQKHSAAQLKKAEAISRFRTIEPIYTSPNAAKPKKALIVIVGFITAFLLSIFLAFFREFLRKG